MPPQTLTKHFEFTGTPGAFFVNFFVSVLMIYIPFVGFAMSFNYRNKWLANNIKIDGRPLSYSAKLGETWVMLIVGLLLTMVTFGIYIFWFGPKVYRYIFDHTTYADEVTIAVAAPVTTAPPEAMATPMEVATPQVAPTPPTNLVQ